MATTLNGVTILTQTNCTFANLTLYLGITARSMKNMATLSSPKLAQQLLHPGRDARLGQIGLIIFV